MPGMGLMRCLTRFISEFDRFSDQSSFEKIHYPIIMAVGSWPTMSFLHRAI